MPKLARIPGLTAIERDANFDDKYLRHVGVRLLYPSPFQSVPSLKTGVLLEVGFGKTKPNSLRQISSWAFDHALASGLKPGTEFKDNRAVDVPCYHPGYTFVEKLQAVSTKYRIERSQSDMMPSNFLRHYYDLHALLAVPEVLEFIGTKDYYHHKQQHFRRDDILSIQDNQAFSLPDVNVFSRYEAEYARIRALFYGEPPTLRQILDRIADHIEQL